MSDAIMTVGVSVILRGMAINNLPTQCRKQVRMERDLMEVADSMEACAWWQTGEEPSHPFLCPDDILRYQASRCLETQGDPLEEPARVSV